MGKFKKKVQKPVQSIQLLKVLLTLFISEGKSLHLLYPRKESTISFYTLIELVVVEATRAATIIHQLSVPFTLS